MMRALYSSAAGMQSQQTNLDIILREETQLPVTIAEEPLNCVVKGAGKVLDEIKLLREVTIPN